MTVFTLKSIQLPSTSDTFAFPSPPASATKRLKTAHARQPTQASFHTDTCERVAMPHRRAPRLPLPNFTFPCQTASRSEVADEPSLPSRSLRNHRRCHAVSILPQKSQLPGQSPPSALPKYLVSSPPQSSHHTYRQKRSSPLQFQMDEEQQHGRDEIAMAHIPTSATTGSSHRNIRAPAYHAESLLFPPEHATYLLDADESRPPCQRMISTSSTAAISTPINSCPKLISDHPPLPQPEAHMKVHAPMEPGYSSSNAVDTADNVPQDFETFKRLLATKLDINTIIEGEEDDDEFWQCRGFAEPRDKKNVTIMRWMRDCDRDIIIGT